MLLLFVIVTPPAVPLPAPACLVLLLLLLPHLCVLFEQALPEGLGGVGGEHKLNSLVAQRLGGGEGGSSSSHREHSFQLQCTPMEYSPTYRCMRTAYHHSEELQHHSRVSPLPGAGSNSSSSDAYAGVLLHRRSLLYAPPLPSQEQAMDCQPHYSITVYS